VIAVNIRMAHHPAPDRTTRRKLWPNSSSAGLYFGMTGQAELETHDVSSLRVTWEFCGFPDRWSRGPYSIPSDRALDRLPWSSIINSESPKVPYRSKLGRRSGDNCIAVQL
jgi:hypothetical protein